jgi:hypothetical protein
MHPFSTVIIAVNSITALIFLTLTIIVTKNRRSYVIGFIGGLLDLVSAILSLCFDMPHAALLYIPGLLLISVSSIPGFRQMVANMNTFGRSR